MKLKIIDFETAKLASEIGFNLTTVYIGYSKEQKLRLALEENTLYLAPEQALLQKWLREQYNLHVEPRSEQDDFLDGATYQVLFSTIITRYENGVNIEEYDTGTFYHTYEEALESGIIKALNFIKDATK